MQTSTTSKHQNRNGLSMESFCVFFSSYKTQQAAKQKVDLLHTVMQDFRTETHLSPPVFEVAPGICIQTTDVIKLRNSLRYLFGPVLEVTLSVSAHISLAKIPSHGYIP